MVKKKINGEELRRKDLWQMRQVNAVPLDQFVKDTADVEKMIIYGESNSGKTRWYLSVLSYLKSIGVPNEHILMYIINPDRATGITKLANLVPREFMGNVKIMTVNNYEDLVMATAEAEERLMEHYKKTGVHGWLVVELLSEMWRMSQDYYSRQAFGESLADLLAAKRQAVAEVMAEKGKEDKTTAFQALSGFADWITIKFFHNFNWVDKIKRMPFNVIFTSEIKKEDNKDSIFSPVGVRPGGEKDNIHRVDDILYLTHKDDKFYQRCFKLTGYDRLYTNVNITDKKGFVEHKKVLAKFEKAGYKSSAIEELEKEAGIPAPKKPEPKVEKPKPVKEEPTSAPAEEIKTISKTPKEPTPPKKTESEDDWDLDI